MIIAQVGCLHGELDLVYQSLQKWEESHGRKIDAVLCCGDFQSLRYDEDMDALECPQKFKRLGDFAKYFSQQKRAPFLTIFVGGNHEASNLLRQLYFGGYVAENIYFLGYAGVMRLKKGTQEVKVGGISGIEKSFDTFRGYFEEHPYIHQPNNLKSLYHIREFEVAKMDLYKEPIDIFVSHEWPTVVTQPTDQQSDRAIQQLTRFKPYFKREIQAGQLGSPLLSHLINTLNLRLMWCSAHLHCHFRVNYPSKDGNGSIEFQSCDKPIPNRRFFDVFQVTKEQTINRNFRDSQDSTSQKHQVKEGTTQDNSDVNKDHQVQDPEEYKEQNQTNEQIQLMFDEDWIAVLKATHSETPLQHQAQQTHFKSQFEQNTMSERVTEELRKVKDQDMEVRFCPEKVFISHHDYGNVHPQTAEFIERFGLDDRLFQPRQRKQQNFQNYNRQDRHQNVGHKRTFREHDIDNQNNHQKQQAAINTPSVEPQIQEPIQKDDNEIDLQF